ncbi:TadE/TadG family type IV pilus assembly protein [Tabrizicola sp.]|uniref:TadE/TadG family type IV pilus assembly protein n=1 Tax=Tabrizicola sp. TaxID=2005166 RepID=UPI003F3EC5AD
MTKLGQFLKDDSGTASIEFVFVFPIIFLIFTASFESSLFMSRYVMLERGVDMTVRKIRLGQLEDIKHQALKEEICKSGIMAGSIDRCMKAMRIWMQPIDTASFAMVAPPKSCVDKATDVNTNEPDPTEFNAGDENQIVLMRVCLKEEPMFPTTLVSVKMPTDAEDGTYALVVTSVFVNEPR